MSNPVSALFLALDKQIEAISDRAFESAVAAGRNERREEPTEREKLLRRVRAKQATRSTLGVADLIDAGYVRELPGNELDLTSLGDYLLPDAADELTGEEQVIEHEQAQAGA